MPDRNPAAEAAHDALVRRYMAQGCIIEAGWIAARATIAPALASKETVAQLRQAYMSGAQHLWASIMRGLDPEGEPTDEDMKRMDLIGAELERWAEEQRLAAMGVEGRA